MTTYSQDFKETMVAKVLHPDGLTIVQLAKEAGVSVSSLYKWKTELKERLTSEIDMTTEIKQPFNRPQNWSAEAKLKAINETFSMTEEQIGAYCREYGIYSNHLEHWRAAMLSGLKPSLQKEQRAENLQLKAQIKELTKQLSRKEKALAETSAILVLKKKASLIWGDAKEE